MARPKVHEHERRTTGLRLIEPVHEALRAYNRDTGVPMARVMEMAVEEKLISLGYYTPGSSPAPSAEPEAQEEAPAKKNGNGTSKRAVVAKKTVSA